MKKIKLGIRLEQLRLMVTSNYDHIWDCCCDHGLLGMALLQQTQLTQSQHEIQKTEIHFVDVVQSLIDQVKTKLQQHPVNDYDRQRGESRWHTECKDVATIKLKKGQTNLLIIAGIGGEKTIELLTEIFSNNKQCDFELLLCPVHQNYNLREFLIQQGYGLRKEKIVKENNRFYELLNVSKSSHKALSLVGSEQWNYSRENDKCYLARMIQHFQRMANDPKKKVNHILTAYLNLQADLQINTHGKMFG